jgi:hypothetical protein
MIHSGFFHLKLIIFTQTLFQSLKFLEFFPEIKISFLKLGLSKITKEKFCLFSKVQTKVLSALLIIFLIIASFFPLNSTTSAKTSSQSSASLEFLSKT